MLWGDDDAGFRPLLADKVLQTCSWLHERKKVAECVRISVVQRAVISKQRFAQGEDDEAIQDLSEMLNAIYDKH